MGIEIIMTTKILLIYTGGTIGMMPGGNSNVLTPFDFNTVREALPELGKLDYEIITHSFDPPIDSSNMQPEIWLQLAKIIDLYYDGVDGFVILHGSDTMAFTASALSFLLEGLAKPVILTGSQLPINEIRTDAKENFLTALELAAAKKDGQARVPEVCIYFNGRLLRGNRTIKWNASGFEAFCSPNYSPLAEAGVHIRFNDALIRQPTEQKFSAYENLDTSISVLKIFPGISQAAIEAILQAKAKVIILEAFGTGNAATESWFLSPLKRAINEGKIILAISQCKKGSVELGRYDTSTVLKEIGVVSGYDMSFEAALCKLMFLLAKEKKTERIKEELVKDLRGELAFR